MIIDKIENLKMYESVNPMFAKVVEFLAQNDLNKLEAGKHEIKGKDLFVNIINQKGKTVDDALATKVDVVTGATFSSKALTIDFPNETNLMSPCWKSGKFS